MSRFLSLTTLMPLMAVVVACSATVPVPASGPHPESAFTPVTFPPPAARPETIPEAPSSSAVWIDGEWRWRRNRWYWVLGRWEEQPPEAAYFAAAKIDYDARGQLLHAPGAWRGENGATLESPQADEVAGTTAGDVVEETGVLEDVGPNRRAQRPKRKRRRQRVTCEVDKKCPFESR